MRTWIGAFSALLELERIRGEPVRSRADSLVGGGEREPHEALSGGTVERPGGHQDPPVRQRVHQDRRRRRAVLRVV